jgi:hypothetical protein
MRCWMGIHFEMVCSNKISPKWINKDCNKQILNSYATFVSAVNQFQLLSNMNKIAEELGLYELRIRSPLLLQTLKENWICL